MSENKLNKALHSAIKQAGSEVELAEASGVARSRINKIKNGSVDLNTIKLGTLRKIFPNMKIDYLGTGTETGYIRDIIRALHNLDELQQRKVYEAILMYYKTAQDNRVYNILKDI